MISQITSFVLNKVNCLAFLSEKKQRISRLILTYVVGTYVSTIFIDEVIGEMYVLIST